MSILLLTLGASLVAQPASDGHRRPANSPPKAVGSMVRTTFQPAPADFPNPERGFYLPVESDLAGLSPREVATAYAKGYRLIYVRIDLEPYRDRALLRALLDRLEERSRRLLACWGNNDGTELRERLPEVARAELAGVRVVVVHETGGRAGRDARMRAAYPDADLLVFGHSHIPWDTEHAGLRLLNPGSPTDRRRQPHGTFVTAVADDGALREVTFHAVPPRTR